MRLCIRPALLLIFGLLSQTTAKQFSKANDAVRLQDIQALTFFKDKWTTHRRVSGMPQMVASGGAATPFYTPESIRCRNSGSSYSAADVEWTCTAQLPPEFKLGSTDVICEGYDNSADEYVLKGSCGVEYRLAFTERGEEKYRNGSPITSRPPRGENRIGFNPASYMDSIPVMLFWLVFLGVAGWIVLGFVRSILSNSRGGMTARRPPRRNTRGGSNYHDDNDDDDAPPPYSPRPPPTYRSTKTKLSGTSGNSRQASNAQGWRPGFWTGAIGGALAGMAAGAGRNQARGTDPGEGPSTRRSTSSSSSGGGSSSYSETRYESTGFGGTRRR